MEDFSFDLLNLEKFYNIFNVFLKKNKKLNKSNGFFFDLNKVFYKIA